MAYPTVEERLTATHASATSWSVPMPASVNAGELLAIFWGSQGWSPTTGNVLDSVPASWTQKGFAGQGSSTGCKGTILVKKADGTEGGTSVTLTQASGEPARPGASIVIRISNWSGDVADIDFIDSPNWGADSSGDPNPPSLTASGGAADNLWIEFGVTYSSAITAASTNYSNLTTESNTAEIATAERQYNTTDTVDPDDMTGSGGANCVAGHIVIPPSTGVSGSGAPAADSATTAGTAEVEKTSSGTPASQSAATAGAAERELTCTGVLNVGSASTSGTATLQVKLLLTAAENRELRDENNSPVASLNGIRFEWYDKDTDTNGSPDVTGTFNTNASGEATIQLSGSSLVAGQYGTLILEHPSNNAIWGVYRIPVS